MADFRTANRRSVQKRPEKAAEVVIGERPTPTP
jgi:hypothetical protein